MALADAIAFVPISIEVWSPDNRSSCASTTDTAYATFSLQVLETLSSNGGTELTTINIVERCGVLAGLALLWRIVHYVALRRAIL